jgi:hypothetical protein
VDSARSKGAGIGLATALKLTPGIFVVYLLLTRRTRAAVVSLAVFAATVALAYLALPGDSREYWGGAFAEPGRVGRIENAANQSLRGALARVLHTADVGGVWLGLAVVVGLAGMALAVGAARRGQEARGFALCALTGLLVSPVSWSHHWTLAVPALGLVALDARRRGSVVGLAACVLAAGTAYAHVIWWVPIDHPLHSELHLDAVGLVLADAYVLAGLVALGAAAVCATRRALTHDARSVEVLVSRGSHGVTHAHRRAKVVSVLALALAGGFAVLVPARSLASGLSGDQCPTPTVSIFDLAVPAASGHQDVEHLVLQSSSAGLSQVLIDDDPPTPRSSTSTTRSPRARRTGSPSRSAHPISHPAGRSKASTTSWKARSRVGRAHTPCRCRWRTPSPAPSSPRAAPPSRPPNRGWRPPNRPPASSPRRSTRSAPTSSGCETPAGTWRFSRRSPSRPSARA